MMKKTSILVAGVLFGAFSIFAVGCSDGADGDTSSSSSSSSSSGVSVAKYCADIMANCSAANAQYPSMESCMAAGEALPEGTAADQAGNTLGCRAYHAGASKGDPATHCPHAGPAGDGVCGNACEGFCAIAAVTCNAEWPAVGECMTSCMAWPTANMRYNTSFTAGNTTECRLYHLSVAGENAAAATTHCPHTVAMSPTCM